MDIFNQHAEKRGAKYSVGYTLRERNPCVIVDRDSVVCEVSKHTTNAEQRVMQIAIALELAYPEGAA